MGKITKIAVYLVIIFVSCLILSESTRAAGLTKGYVSFTFDDGDKTLYQNVRPIFKNLGLVGTSYVVTDYVGDDAHVSWSQLKILQSTDGWEIGNHTKSHKDLSTLSDQNILTQINGAQTAFANKGIQNVKAFAPPFGEFSAHIIDLMKSTGQLNSNRQAWTEDDSFNTVSNFNPWAINVVSLKSDISFSQAKALIDEAVKDKKWLVFVVHVVVDQPLDIYQYKTKDLNSIASYAAALKKSGQLDVVTVSKGVGLLGGAPPPTPTPVPVPTGENLIKNPGFDSGWTNWHQAGSGASIIDVTQATANQYSPYPGQRLKIAGGSGEYTAYTDDIKLPANVSSFIFREWANITITKGRFGIWVDELDSSGKYLGGKELGGFTSSVSGSALTEFKYQRSSANVSYVAINIYSEAGTSGTGLFDSCYFGQ